MEYIPLWQLVTSSITKSGFQDFFIDLRSLYDWDLQQKKCIEKLNQFFIVLLEEKQSVVSRKQSVVSRKQSVVFLQQFDRMWISSINWERFKTAVIAHKKNEINHELVIWKVKTRKVLSFYEVLSMSHCLWSRMLLLAFETAWTSTHP